MFQPLFCNLTFTYQTLKRHSQNWRNKDVRTQSVSETDKQTHSQTDRQTVSHRQTDRKKERKKERQSVTNRQTDRKKDSLRAGLHWEHTRERQKAISKAKESGDEVRKVTFLATSPLTRARARTTQTWACSQANRKTDRKTESQSVTDRQIDRQRNRETVRHGTDIQIKDALPKELFISKNDNASVAFL